MFRLITIEREFGCGAASIAHQLAERLGWKLWDQRLTEEIARIAQVDPSAVKRCDERMDSRLHRWAKVFWRGSYERSTELGHQIFDTDRMMAMMQDIMDRIALLSARASRRVSRLPVRAEGREDASHNCRRAFGGRSRRNGG